VKLAAEVQARVPLEKIEFLRNGEVIHAETINSKLRPYRVEYETEVRESAWFAMRVSGPPSRGLTGPARAHSSPVWVSLGGKPTLVERDLETAVRWTDRFWANLVERDNFGPDPNRDQAKKMVDEARAHYVEKLRRIR
jgi:hypothetical protein